MFHHLALCILLALIASPALAVTVPTGFEDVVRIHHLSDPVGLAFLPDGRLFVTERITGSVKLWTGAGIPITATTVPHVRSAGESGLLSIAVDPGWPARPYVYVHYNHYAYPDSDVRIVRLTCEGDLDFTGDGSLTIDFAKRYDVLTGNRDVFPTHNGGTLRFGPDGMLYASFGDDNNSCAAQDTSNRNGKILRLDVSSLPDGSGGPASSAQLTPHDNPFVPNPRADAHLVYAMGLRNPFRFHIDPLTGDLFVADVGLDRYEEIDRVPANAGGLNFGWPWREGPQSMGTCARGETAGFTEPIWSYGHDSGFAAISVGLYRRNGGSAQFPLEYDGSYFFQDYYLGDVYRLERAGDGWQIAPPVSGQPGSAWGKGFWFAGDWTIGPDGAMWWCDGSSVHRLAYANEPDVDPPVVTPPDDRVFYDLQGRRVQKPERNGLYFTRGGKKRVVLN